jgi:hypothetical protein
MVELSVGKAKLMIYGMQKLSIGLCAIIVLVSGCQVGPFKSKHDAKSNEPTVTYHAAIKPLIAEKCLSCHGTGGQAAAMAIATYEDATRNKERIETAVNNRTMPPFLAAKGHQTYKDDMSLSDGELELFNLWFTAGMPEGSQEGTKAEPELTHTGQHEMRSDLAVAVVASGGTGFLPNQALKNEYRCFIQELDLGGSSKYVTGFQAVPGNQSIVHHMVSYIMDDAELAIEVAKFENKDGRPGYQCFGGALPDDFTSNISAADLERRSPYWLSHWAPGMAGVNFPEGTGVHVAKGSKLITQIHYYTSDTPGAVDQNSRVLLQLRDSVARPSRVAVLGRTEADGTGYPDIELAPGETKTYTGTHKLGPMLAVLKAKAGTDLEYTGIEVHSSNLHMHAMGDSTKAWLIRPDGKEESLLDIPHWNLHWQRDFFFTEPKVFTKAELSAVSLDLSCTFTNTRDVAIHGGPGSEDEMCLNFVYLSLVR